MEPRQPPLLPGGGFSRHTLSRLPRLWEALRAREGLVWLSLSVVDEVEWLTPTSRKLCFAFLWVL